MTLCTNKYKCCHLSSVICHVMYVQMYSVQRYLVVASRSNAKELMRGLPRFEITSLWRPLHFLATT